MSKTVFLCAAWAAVFLTACVPRRVVLPEGDPAWGVEVTWHGHSCFSLRDSAGRTIVIDPFDETVGYGRLNVRADALLITHNHFDHNHIRAVKPRVRDLDMVRTTEPAVVAHGLVVGGVVSAHDGEGGEIHGPNIIFTFMMGGLRVVHMGDHGTPDLTPAQRAMMGRPDILMMPVGGATTIGAEEAKQLVDELRPRAVFPMHFGDIRFYRLADVEDFAALFPPEAIRRQPEPTVRVTATADEETVVYLLPSVLPIKTRNN